MQHNLSDIQIDYNGDPLLEENLPDNPLTLFHNWFEQISATYNSQPNAMILSTQGKNGFPQARVVLLKEYSDKGFSFYTNYNSQKGKGIKKNNKVSLTFYWPELERQVRIEGLASKTTEKESDDYFSSRPFDSRISAIISDQSQKVPSRNYLDDKVEQLRENLKTTEPERPDFWGGYIVSPVSVEFWQGRPNRLHDRILYKLKSEKWKISRLAP
ncbi:pyridoxamine 5'-phosphate oxidase [Saccharicrinis sp. FJH62]|uniref:pyridoxamine 5'-phosphate oxidase n=1 Tax=Saccharicrinis sp. FJH62 TaxID=3344657 RepID=UPI0035D50766